MVVLLGERDVDSDGDPVRGVGVIHEQLGSNLRRDEPDELGGQHEDDEGDAADGDDGAGGGGLRQILGDLPVNVESLHVENHLEQTDPRTDRSKCSRGRLRRKSLIHLQYKHRPISLLES